MPRLTYPDLGPDAAGLVGMAIGCDPTGWPYRIEAAESEQRRDRTVTVLTVEPWPLPSPSPDPGEREAHASAMAVATHAFGYGVTAGTYYVPRYSPSGKPLWDGRPPPLAAPRRYGRIAAPVVPR